MTKPNPDLGHPPRRIDARADLHGRVLDYMREQDRRWFEAHPGVDVRHRRVLEHEFCDPAHYPECRPAFEVPERPGMTSELWVEVRRINAWARARWPYALYFREPAA